MERQYRFAKTRNRGFRRPKTEAISSVIVGEALYGNYTHSPVAHPAVSQAISLAAPPSNRREQPKTESNDATHKPSNKSCSQSNKPAKPNCYKCQYRGVIPGNAHSECKHPIFEVVDGGKFYPTFFMMQGLRSPFEKRMNVTYSQHRFDNGWFFWPSNFDPVWLESCDGFTPKEDS